MKSAPESSGFHLTGRVGILQRCLGHVLHIKMEHKAKLLKLVVVSLDVLAG